MFDQEPDGDPHGECAAEIHRLQRLNAELLEILHAIINDGVHCDVVPHLHSKAVEAIAKSGGAA
jgi:predicted subunit of tRNA(5-methylaminomethyl-2-thiouridylate) methyltransferase